MNLREPNIRRKHLHGGQFQKKKKNNARAKMLHRHVRRQRLKTNMLKNREHTQKKPGLMDMLSKVAKENGTDLATLLAGVACDSAQLMQLLGPKAEVAPPQPTSSTAAAVQ